MSKDIKKNYSGYRGGAKLTSNVRKSARYSQYKDIYVHRKKYNKQFHYKVFRMKKPKGAKVKQPYLYSIDVKNRVEFTVSGKSIKMNVGELYNSIVDETEWDSDKFNKDKLPMEVYAVESMDRGGDCRNSILKCSKDGFFYNKENPNIQLPRERGLTLINGKLIDGTKAYWLRKLFFQSNNKIRDNIGKGKKDKFGRDFKVNFFKPEDIVRLITSQKVQVSLNKDPIPLTASNTTVLHENLLFLLEDGGNMKHVKLNVGKRHSYKKNKDGKRVHSMSDNWSISHIAAMHEGKRYLYDNKNGRILQEFEKDKWLMVVDLAMKHDTEKIKTMTPEVREEYLKPFQPDDSVETYFGSRVMMDTINIIVSKEEINNCAIKPYTNILKELGMKRMSTYACTKSYEIGATKDGKALVTLYVGRDRDNNEPYIYGYRKRNKRNVYMEIWKDKDGNCKINGKTYNVNDELFKKEGDYKEFFHLKEIPIEIISKHLVEGDKVDFENLLITDKGTIVTTEDKLIMPEIDGSDRGIPGITIINGVEIYGPALFVRCKHEIYEEENTISFTKDYKSKYRNLFFPTINVKEDAIRAHPNIHWNSTKVKMSMGFGNSDKKYEVDSFVILSNMKNNGTGLLSFDVYWRETGELIVPESYEMKDSTTGEIEHFSYYDTRIRVKGLDGNQRYRFASYDLYYS